MSICVLSDTHNNLEATLHAAKEIDRIDPDVVIHCGDLMDPTLLEPFAGRKLYFVYGNNDNDVYGIDRVCRRLGFIAGPYHAIEIDGRAIYACHGHKHHRNRAIESQSYDVVFYGHSHVPEDTRRGRVRVVNPGALYRAQTYSIAAYEPAGDSLRFIPIPKR